MLSGSAVEERQPTAPAMGERHARWGYGYQDKAATQRIIEVIKNENRRGAPRLEGVRLADVRAGRVDDFVLVWDDRVEGNSIKWRRSGKSMTWGQLVDKAGLMRELADGYESLKRTWEGRGVRVRLQTSYLPSERHHGQSVAGVSVEEFLRKHWECGPEAVVSGVVQRAWMAVESRSGLNGEEFVEFVRACELSIGVREAQVEAGEDEESRQYKRQFDDLHKALATWIAEHPESEVVDRAYLFEALGLRPHRSDLVQRFPSPRIPYRRNGKAAGKVGRLLAGLDGGYLAVVGATGVGKSTLVQDVLGTNEGFVLIPYFAFLPDGEGSPRDRGEALAFYRNVVGRLDREFPGRGSLGIDRVEHGREALRRHMAQANHGFVAEGRKTVLLVDGLDHVTRESGIRESIIR